MTEYTVAGALIALFSVFTGFYASAITFASQSYPELNIGIINEIHRRILANLVLTSAVTTALAAGFFYLLARRYAARAGR